MSDVLNELELEKALSSGGGGSNKPRRVAGTPGTTGPRSAVSSDEQRKRRNAMSQLLANGVANAEIEAALAQKFGMTPKAVAKLRGEVRAEWSEEDQENARYAKAAAVRRLRRHILRASDSKQYNAVAMLEKTLMQIEGTSEPVEVRNVDGRVVDALMNLLRETDPAEVRLMVEQEIVRNRVVLTGVPEDAPAVFDLGARRKQLGGGG